MLASQFNLDHRLAELRQIGLDLRDAQAARGTNGSTRSIATAIRFLLGWAPAARPVRATGH
jgi:hypothetical protein